MVLYLVRNVLLHLGQLRRTHGKRAITLLPREFVYAVLMNPRGRTALDLPNHVSQCVGCLQSGQNVDMDSCPTNRTCKRSKVTCNASDVSMQFLTPRLRDDPAAAFRAKNVVVKLMWVEGMARILAPFQGAVPIILRLPGVALVLLA